MYFCQVRPRFVVSLARKQHFYKIKKIPLNSYGNSRIPNLLYFSFKVLKDVSWKVTLYRKRGYCLQYKVNYLVLAKVPVPGRDSLVVDT